MKHIMIIAAAILALLIAQSSYAQPPFDCMNSEAHRAFDFWLGEWEVHDPNGAPQGHNQITSVQNGCAIEEHWKSVSGGTGQSINYYHPGQSQWHQLWTDGGASIIDISGNVHGDSMILEGTIFYLKPGTEHPFRGSWKLLEDGRVRQFFEQEDSQGNWQTWFEGYYTRSETKTP